MSDLSKQLKEYYSMLDPNDQAKVLQQALELSQKNQSTANDLLAKTILPSDLTSSVGTFMDPQQAKLERAKDVLRTKAEANIFESQGKLGGTLSDFQKRAFDSRRGDRGLGYTAVVSDLLKNLALINKL
jgi:hypothetical protein